MLRTAAKSFHHTGFGIFLVDVLMVVVDARYLASWTSIHIVEKEWEKNQIVDEVLQESLVICVLLVYLKRLRTYIICRHLRILNP